MDSGNQVALWNCRIDASGRIVLPHELRAECKLDHGDELVITIEDGAIVIRTYAAAMQRLQDQFCADLPEGVSLADELMEERKQEATRDERR